MPTINKVKKKRVYNKHTNGGKLHAKFATSSLRESYIMEHPLCEMCLEEGKTTPVEEVHHKIPICTGKDELEQLTLAMDYNNLISLCKYHHYLIHHKCKK